MTLCIDNKPYIPDDARENMIHSYKFLSRPHPMGLPYIDVAKTYYPEKPMEREYDDRLA